jgi:hypothetical protein
MGMDGVEVEQYWRNMKLDQGYLWTTNGEQTDVLTCTDVH